NYWGHPSGPFDNSNTDGQGLTNPGGLGDKASEYVNWSPFLTSESAVGEPPVLLAIARAGNLAILSWPYYTTGYSLQSVTNLTGLTNTWVAVTNNPVLIDGRYTV